MKTDLFIRGVRLENTSNKQDYPYSIPAIRELDKLKFTSPVSFLVGENGTGKSTILESLAVAAGFNAEGGTKNYNFSTEDSTSPLFQNLRLIRGVRREKYGYFLRAESFYTTANYAEKGTFGFGDKPIPLLFGGKHIHEQSHGEAFLAIVKSFRPGLFFFDEPESALSPKRLLILMATMHELTKQGSQFIVATHSPILLAYPNATIYELSDSGIITNQFTDLEHVSFTKDFLNNPRAYTDKLFSD